MTLQPAPGTGKTTLVDQVQLRIGVLRNLSQYFERLTDASGALVCPRHRVEHTGKVVYAALINHDLWRYSREEECLERARRQVLRAVDHLGEDPESHVPVFLPGRVDPRNASTNAIDGGACADVIATLLEELPELFDDEQRERCTAALVRHVDGYLRHAARERPITAQRLWAATGVARAARLLQRDDWREDALAGCALALQELAADGVAPYIPAHTDHCTHPGLADVSTFYHSRTPGFVLYVHDVLGVPLDALAAGRVRASLDALVAMRDGNGHKVLHNEAKAWYWESAYEVASHPFDAYALHTGARMLDVPLYRNEAGRVMEEWIAHLDPLEGGARSHHGRGTNFQCPVFWSGHGAWAARVLADVPVRGAAREGVDVDLRESGLLHVERPRYVAVLRGAKQAAGNLFGCDAGGGTLQSLVVRPDARTLHGVERIDTARHSSSRDGSFEIRAQGSPGRLRRFAALLREERSDLRFRLYIASVEWKARAPLRAVLYALRHVLLRSWRDARPWDAAHRDTGTEHDYRDGRVVFRGGVADHAGRRVPGATTERAYRFEEGGVVLEDVLRLDGVQGQVRYRLPAQLEDGRASADGATLSRRGRVLSMRVQGEPATLTVTGLWRA